MVILILNYKSKIVYIADIDQDIDDLIAIDYLNKHELLDYVVLDPLPVNTEGNERVLKMLESGIRIEENITNTEVLFVGGGLTKVNDYLKKGLKLKLLVMNGGFIGSNIVKEDNQLIKFKGMDYVRTFNFNIDVKSTLEVLNSNLIDKIYLVGKNVCHDEKNTIKGIWKNEVFLNKYNLKFKKRLHDLLMVSEGICILEDKQTMLSYKQIKVSKRISEKNNKEIVEWGSVLCDNSNILGAVEWL